MSVASSEGFREKAKERERRRDEKREKRKEKREKRKVHCLAQMANLIGGSSECM